MELEPEVNLPPTAPVKVPKPRKPMTQETRDKLAQARVKANEIRKQNQANRLDKKLEKINAEIEETEKAKKELPNPEPLPDPEPEPDPYPASPRPSSPVKDPKPEITTKTKKKKNTKIIVEQSSDDSDEFEANDKVIFVKRVSRQKKNTNFTPAADCSPANNINVNVIENESVYQPPSKMYQPPSSVAPPPRPVKSHQEKMYDNMFSGGFLRRF
jgi:TolA-binding protein